MCAFVVGLSQMLLYSGCSLLLFFGFLDWVFLIFVCASLLHSVGAPLDGLEAQRSPARAFDAAATRWFGWLVPITTHASNGSIHNFQPNFDVRSANADPIDLHPDPVQFYAGRYIGVSIFNGSQSAIVENIKILPLENIGTRLITNHLLLLVPVQFSQLPRYHCDLPLTHAK